MREYPGEDHRLIRLISFGNHLLPRLPRGVWIKCRPRDRICGVPGDPRGARGVVARGLPALDD